MDQRSDIFIDETSRKGQWCCSELSDPYDRSEELTLIRTAAFAAAFHGQIRPSDDPYLTHLEATVQADVMKVTVIGAAMKSHRLYYLHLAQTLTKLNEDGIKLNFEDLRRKEEELRGLKTSGFIFKYCQVFHKTSLKAECR
ncbi:unnamed protein product [Bursaphelenchus xylophilus]|uniref:(pine wood nematode) hypothetical protein n=1 Tax=Bursaphelenchus xylophilus TaxID=6326 RepID=A0A811M2S7_BURXY|nr:unnamed protein product [Bursaphelenchus xylophilus]CAG9130972.1 unnamed protein product [Bursaphelenchus xylophilus]